MIFTPNNAPAVALLFLGTVLLVGIGVAAGAWLVYRRRFVPARRIGEALAVVLLVYGGALLAHSFTSRDRSLEPGQLKYFCEIDCHLAYSVESVRTAPSLGSAPSVAAQGRFLVVTVKTWFDPDTISPHRGNGELHPNPRTIELEDSAGIRHRLSLEGESVLAAGADPREPLSRPLRPGESYTTDLVFDLPPAAKAARLLITENLAVAPFIVSHENSLFHGKIWFRLPEPGNS
jgi:hypothetical protein